MLSTAPKFLLPNCAELIDVENVRETHLELLRLPYPVTVFEAPWRKADITPAATVAGVQEKLVNAPHRLVLGDDRGQFTRNGTEGNAPVS